MKGYKVAMMPALLLVLAAAGLVQLHQPAPYLTGLTASELLATRGSELVSCQALRSDSCNNAPVGWSGSYGSASCNSCTLTATMKGGAPWASMEVTIGTTVCLGGCGDKCVSTDTKKWCGTSPGSWCEKTQEHSCTGGTLYDSNEACGPALTPCDACNYSVTSSGC